MGSAAARAAGLVALAGAIASACVFGGTFVCEGDGECPRGRCEPSGFCSFPDDACASGRRYSEWAGEGLADACTQQASSDESGAAAESSADGSSTTFTPDLGPPADRNPSSFECGNGMLEVGEICDDGNLVDGDGCDADCVRSGAQLWSFAVDGPNSGDDFAHAVALLPDGDIVVTGRFGQYMGDMFVKGIATDDHAELWNKLVGSASSEEGRALAIGKGARFVVGGYNSPDGAGENLYARTYDLVPDSDPANGWSKSYGDAQHKDERTLGVALREDFDEVIQFGFVHAPDATRTYVRALALSTGDYAWSVIPDVKPGTTQLLDDARAGIVASTGRVYMVGTIVNPGTGMHTEGWIAELDVSLAPQTITLGARAELGTEMVNDVVEAIAEAPDGSLVVAGHLGNHGFFARYDAELQPIGAPQIPDPTSISEVLAVAIDQTGAVVTAGYITSDAHGRDVEIVKYLANGERVWRDRIDGGIDADDQARGVAIGDDDTVIVVGNVRREVTGSDLWVAKYAP